MHTHAHAHTHTHTKNETNLFHSRFIQPITPVTCDLPVLQVLRNLFIFSKQPRQSAAKSPIGFFHICPLDGSGLLSHINHFHHYLFEQRNTLNSTSRAETYKNDLLWLLLSKFCSFISVSPLTAVHPGAMLGSWRDVRNQELATSLFIKCLHPLHPCLSTHLQGSIFPQNSRWPVKHQRGLQRSTCQQDTSCCSACHLPMWWCCHSSNWKMS